MTKLRSGQGKRDGADANTNAADQSSGDTKIAYFLINVVESAKMFVNYSFFTLCLLHMAKCL